MVVCLPIFGILPLMVVGRVYQTRPEDGTCMLGERRYTTGTVLAWDIFSAYQNWTVPSSLFGLTFFSPQARYTFPSCSDCRCFDGIISTRNYEQSQSDRSSEPSQRWCLRV